MLTQLTNFLGLTPNTAPIETKSPDTGDVDFADVFARIETNRDHPEAEENTVDISPDAEEAADKDEISKDVSDDAFVISAADPGETGHLTEDVDAVDFGKALPDREDRAERLALFEQGSSESKTTAGWPTGTVSIDENVPQEGQPKANLRDTQEPWIARTRMRIENSREAGTADRTINPLQVGENAPAPGGSLPPPNAQIKGFAPVQTIPADTSPRRPTPLSTDVASSIATVAANSDVGLAGIETATGANQPDPAAKILAESPPMRPMTANNTPTKIDVESPIRPLDKPHPSEFPTPSDVGRLLRPDQLVTPVKATKTENIDVQNLKVDPPIKDEPFRQPGAVFRSDLAASSDSGVIKPETVAQQPRENIARSNPDDRVSTPATPLTSLPSIADEADALTARNLPQATDSGLTRFASATDQTPPPVRAAIETDPDIRLAQQQSASSTVAPDRSTPQIMDEPSDVTFRTVASDQKPISISSTFDTSAKAPAGSVDTSTEMPVLVRQLQPTSQQSPHTNRAPPATTDAAEVFGTTKAAVTTVPVQSSVDTAQVSGSIDWSKEPTKPVHWSQEAHLADPPTAVKSRTATDAPAEPQAKLALTTPAIQPSSVNYPFLAVADDEKETLDVALQPSPTELRGLQSSTVAPNGIPTARPDPALVMRQVADGIQKLSEAGGVELRLSPEELGSVRMQFIQGESGLTVHINAERPETLDLLRRNIDQLAKDLAASGFDTAGFSFGDENSAGQQHKAGSTNLEPTPEDIIPTEQLNARGLDGLDIRV